MHRIHQIFKEASFLIIKMTKNLTEVIRRTFESKQRRTLKELYSLLQDYPGIEVPQDKLKHRVRSSLYNLQKTKEIKRIGSSTYQKNE